MGAIMVNGTLMVCSGIASTTLWFNNYDCRCSGSLLTTGKAIYEPDRPIREWAS
jgi:hypothetical protein